MILDDKEGARVDLWVLNNLVKRAIDDVHLGFEELGRLGTDCHTAVQQRGNQAAWWYVDFLSMKMEEMSEKLAKESQELHKWLEERDRYNAWLEKQMMEEYLFLLKEPPKK